MQFKSDQDILWSELPIFKRAYHTLKVMPRLCQLKTIWPLIRSFKSDTLGTFFSRGIRTARGQSQNFSKTFRRLNFDLWSFWCLLSCWVIPFLIWKLLSIALLKMCILHHMIPGVYISTKNQNFSVSGFQTLKLFQGSIAMTYCFQPKNWLILCHCAPHPQPTIKHHW